jgi:hypothetical protein
MSTLKLDTIQHPDAAGAALTFDSDGSITTMNLAAGLIDSDAIGSGAVSANKIASGAVEAAMTTPIGGRRNLIINGAMQVAQRGTSATGITSSGYYGPDRWQSAIGGGTYSISQVSDSPNGLASSYKIQCTTTDGTLDAADVVQISQKIEGLNLQSIAKGTSDAKQLSWSFWVKSNMTGTYQTNIREKDNNRLVGATYTIDSADTWEYKTIVFPADTTGVIDNNNGQSMQIEFFLRAGSNFSTGSVPTTWATADNTNRGAGLTVDIADSTSNYWQITGAQLEVGSVATPFEHRSYGEELALCQRYFHIIEAGSGDRAVIVNGSAYTSTTFYGVLNYPIQMRTSPSCSLDFSSNDIIVYGNNSATSASSGDVVFERIGINGLRFRLNNLSVTQGSSYWAELNNTANYKAIKFDAEL